MTRARALLAAVLPGVVLLGLGGCGSWDEPNATLGALNATNATLGTSSSADSRFAVAAPGRLRGDLRTADVLVVGDDPLSVKLRGRIADVPGVRGLEPLSVASVRLGDRAITVAAVRPGSYRRFTQRPTAASNPLWRAVAGGEAAVSHEIARDFRQPLGGTLALRTTHEVRLRIGAYATTVPRVDAVVNQRRGTQLGMVRDNAVVVSVSSDQLDAAATAIRELAGKRAEVSALTQTAPANGAGQAAYLTGGAVARAVGAFGYEYFADGTVRPDTRWVAANIRTETVPILGRVTCHRVMLRQLRAALAELERRGLAELLDPADFGGCYVPRFIGHDPRRGLSLHTWGIAVDLNVSGNQRGTAGELDPRVVQTFKRWGFAWGGDWSWTDPMHFELAALVR